MVLARGLSRGTDVGMEKRGSGVTVSSLFLQNTKNAKSNAESVETVATKKNVDRKKILGIRVLECWFR